MCPPADVLLLFLLSRVGRRSPAAEQWRESKKKKKLSDAECKTMWDGLTRAQQASATQADQDYKQRVEVAKAKVAAGTATTKDTKYAERGGYALHASKEEAALDQAEADRIRASLLKISTDRMQFAADHLNQCSVAGCLAVGLPSCCNEADHTTRAGESGEVSTIIDSAAKSGEMAECTLQLLCAYHHYLKTR